ncbi:MAG TPA: HNH endonuclease domain-containing protein, partial [Bacteroidales bacterium]|nr:HNH endonuclease domain-containing protein [Bacteroidales bacterium]
MSKILGLDLGTNSIGWAVVDKENNQFSLVDKGVRIFQEGVKIEKGIESSKAAERTKYRSARRIKYRRKLRKIQTLKVLSEYGFCPTLTESDLNMWRFKKIYPENLDFRKWWVTDDENNVNPYYYRNLAVTIKLDMSKKEERFKIGRAFYHITQRRGFLSNRLETTKESDGVVTSSINELSEKKGELTLGQYFYQKYLNLEKIRDTYTHREAHYLEEFEKICSFQELPNEFVEQLRKAIFYQRPLKSQKGLIGKCVFEKNKPRCAVSHPLFEEYRMLCFINNIKIKTPNEDKLRFLNSQERAKVVERFFLKRDNFEFEDIAKVLAPKKQYKFYKNRNINAEDYLFNYSMSTTVAGCPVTARFADLFGDQLISDNHKIVITNDGSLNKVVHDAWHALLTFDNETKLKEFSLNKLLLDCAKTEEYIKIRLKQDFASLSIKAIKKILPYLREGIIYSHAVFLANMSNCLPAEIWNLPENQYDISNQITTIINTQKQEKEIVELVNGIIKNCRENGECWSPESEDYFLKDVREVLINYFGKNTYSRFSETYKTELESKTFELLKKQMLLNNGRGEFAVIETIDERLKDFISKTYKVDSTKLLKMYHPSAIDVYKEPERSADGYRYLGSPMISAIKNPMAMRALHQLRKVINELIRNGVIDQNTRISIEMSRDLMNANERKAYQSWQRDREKLRDTYRQRIQEYYTSQNSTLTPTDDDILKYQLWEEQKHKCLYTGKEILLSGFLGANPSFDIEHTIPRSLSFDNSQVNKTLCDNVFNRSVKKNRIPFELENHSDIIIRIEDWRKKIEDFEIEISKAVRQSKNAPDKEFKDRAIQKRHKLTFERDYWYNKCKRFDMIDVPDGFKNSQIVDTGIITKYARMYLNTIFEKVYTVKGSTVADFRKIWGLQDEYIKKERSNHLHHCIDAITIACITKDNYENLAKFYHDWEEMDRAKMINKPIFEKPWSTFTEDLKNIENEVLISHYTADVLPKQSRIKLRKRGKIVKTNLGQPIIQKGDTVRGSLHKETFYGAIERKVLNKKGEEEKQIKYVVRKSILDIKAPDIDKIVDDVVTQRVLDAVESGILVFTGTNQKNKLNGKIWMSEDKGVEIKKVRIFVPSVTNPIHLKENRDKTLKNRKPHKEFTHVANDSNYAMAIYEGVDEKGKLKRDFELVNNIEAANFYKISVQRLLNQQSAGNNSELFPSFKLNGKDSLNLKGVVKIGTLVLLYEKSSNEIWDLEQNDLQKRLYKITGLSMQAIQGKYFYGVIVMKHHQEA